MTTDTIRFQYTLNAEIQNSVFRILGGNADKKYTIAAATWDYWNPDGDLIEDCLVILDDVDKRIGSIGEVTRKLIIFGDAATQPNSRIFKHKGLQSIKKRLTDKDIISHEADGEETILDYDEGIRSFFATDAKNLDHEKIPSALYSEYLTYIIYTPHKFDVKELLSTGWSQGKSFVDINLLSRLLKDNGALVTITDTFESNSTGFVIFSTPEFIKILAQ